MEQGEELLHDVRQGSLTHDLGVGVAVAALARNRGDDNSEQRGGAGLSGRGGNDLEEEATAAREGAVARSRGAWISATAQSREERGHRIRSRRVELGSRVEQRRRHQAEQLGGGARGSGAMSQQELGEAASGGRIQCWGGGIRRRRWIRGGPSVGEPGAGDETASGSQE